MKILISETGKTFLVRSTAKDFHSQYGFVKKQNLKKQGLVKTNTGTKLHLLPTSFPDLFKKLQRAPQIITLKDAATIATETGINKKSVVVDAGSGSGALACYLATICKKVTSYEIRPDFHKVAQNNQKLLKLKNLTIRKGSIYEKVKEKDVDVLTLDVPEPWKALSTAAKILKPGGFIASYSPTIPQTNDFVTALSKDKKFIHIKTVENIQREWDAHERKVRPKTSIMNHTGFITIARKIE